MRSLQLDISLSSWRWPAEVGTFEVRSQDEQLGLFGRQVMHINQQVCQNLNMQALNRNLTLCHWIYAFDAGRGQLKLESRINNFAGWAGNIYMYASDNASALDENMVIKATGPLLRNKGSDRQPPCCWVVVYKAPG